MVYMKGISVGIGKVAAAVVYVGMASVGSAASASEPVDSIADKELSEVTVEVRRETTSATVSTYMPTPRVKDAAQNAIDLLTRMAIPQIMVDPVTKDVKTTAGRPVSVFINFLPATKEEISGLRTADVRRVEVLDFPTDPRFQGAEHVVNIIMQQYEYGGYTKVTEKLFGFDDFTNQASVYSKFAYRGMVYDLCVSPDYVNASNVGNGGVSRFLLPGGEITREQRFEKSRFRYVDIPVSLRASYSKGGVQVVNTVGFDYFDKMRGDSYGRLLFTPSAGSDAVYLRATPARNKTLTWRGNYYFAMARGWSLSLTPMLDYTDNRSDSRYESGIPGEEPIVNDAREKSVYARLNVKLLKQFGSSHSVFFAPNALYSRYKVDYIGDSPYETVYENPFVGLAAGYNFSTERFSGGVDAGVAGEFMTINGRKRDDWYPYFHLNGAYSPSDRHRLSVYAQYATNTPGEAKRSPNVIQVNELLYRTGNPMVENSRHWTFNLGYTFIPMSKLSLSAGVYYYTLRDRGVDTYSLYDGGRAVLRGFDNSGDYTNLQGYLSATVRLFSNSLILQGGLSVNSYKSTGYYEIDRVPLFGQLNAQYYWRGFSFSAYYQSRYRAFDPVGGSWSTNRDYYSLQAGWNHGPVNISVSALNFARRRYDGSWSELVTPVYSTVETSYTSNYRQCFMLSLTYTVGYGKKVDHRDEVGRASRGGSAIMQ